MNLKQIQNALALSLLFSAFLNAEKEPKATEKDEEKIEQIKIGNFALPTSQQLGPLIGFGQSIIDKGDLQLFVYVDQLKGKNKNYKEIAPSIVYGIKDNLSIFIEFPSALRFRLDDTSSHGIEDALIQFEYAFYAKETSTSVNQATIVAGITFPTGSVFNKTPSTGLGAPGFFLGFTASHTATDWYYFISSGTTISTKHKNTQFGKQFLYQAGLSKNISYRSDTWILNWLIEFDGIYRQKNRLLGSTDQNSGGNQILLGPSLWFSTQKLIVQTGISWIVSQHLFGVQNKDRYYLVANFSWKF